MMWGEVRGPGGGRGRGAAAAQAAQAARTRRTRVEGWGQGTGAERTSNIQRMSVTLDVSKLSGWLNAFACCRVGRRVCDAGRGVRAGRRGRRES